jgi:hypothetical protein
MDNKVSLPKGKGLVWEVNNSSQSNVEVKNNGTILLFPHYPIEFGVVPNYLFINPFAPL